MIDWRSLMNYTLKWGYKKWHIEKDFQAEIFRNMRKYWWICFHIQDIWLWYRFLDWIIVSPTGDPWFIEFKKIKWATFNISQFEPSQVDLLMELDSRSPWLAMVFIYSEKYWTYAAYSFTQLWTSKNSKGGIKIF